MRKLFRFFILIHSFILLVVPTLTDAAPGMRRVANLYLCNSKIPQYCFRTPAYGHGHGMIVFEEGRMKKSYPVLPWGRNLLQTSKIATTLKGFINQEILKQEAKTFINTRKFMASGFVGMDPFTKRQSVFYLTSLE